MSEKPKDKKENDGGYTFPRNPNNLQRAPSARTIRQWSLEPDSRIRTWADYQSVCERENEKKDHKNDNNISSDELEGTEHAQVGLVTSSKTQNASAKRDGEDISSTISECSGQTHLEKVVSNKIQEMTKQTDTCIECVKPVYVFSSNDINPGDHIAFVGRIYDHHAIVVNVLAPSEEAGEQEVRLELVHATNTSSRAFSAIVNPFGRIAKVTKNMETVDLRNRKVVIYKYSDTIEHYSPAEIVTRAIQEAYSDQKGEQGQFKYLLLDNNCEHFATWCVTGRKLSLQVWKVGMVLEMFLKSAFIGISDERIRNQKAYERGVLCDTCFSRNKELLSVKQKQINHKNDVNVGDIITFSYYNFWHCAVVLQITETTEKVVKCNIAHYAFCGLKHHTILDEPITIPLDGSMLVTKYSEDYNVYEPEEVVERARSRIGEQMFAYFSNDSCHFTRWCKLKLYKK